ncbi:MAG: DNA-binding protein [Nitrososphaerota archaeon]
MSEDEDISLRMLRLKKLRKMMAEASQRAGPEVQKPQEEPASSKLLKHLADRGDEVLEAAKELNPELTEQVSRVLLKAIEEGKVRPPITGGELLQLFRRLGLDIHISTRVAVYKKGETRELKEFLEESWKQL